MNTYQETLDFIFSQLPMFQKVGEKAYNKNLDKTIALDDYFHNPHKEYATIHVGGTNGKGSVSHLIAAILQEAGYKVGLYTSPHLKDFRERIKVNGKPCSKDFVVDFIAKNQKVISQLTPSFFEMTVAMAFQYFKEQEVDVAIIEVGLGGRLDSTNIITPKLSVITNISLDHTDFLGTTLPKIALEKVGIIKPKVPIIIGEHQDETAPVFRKKAVECKAPLHFADETHCLKNIKKTNTGLYFDWEGISNITCPLQAAYQRKNINTALTAIDVLQKNKTFIISDYHISKGCQNIISSTDFKGRWQILSKTPLVVCETAHNEAGIHTAMEELKNLSCKTMHIVLGVSNDKDVSHILPLFPQTAQYYFTQAKIPRAMPSEQLKSLAKEHNLCGESFPSVALAFEAAQKAAATEDCIYVGGSIFVVAEMPL